MNASNALHLCVVQVLLYLAVLCGCTGVARGEEPFVEVSSLQELAHVATQNGHSVRMRPGVYQISEYLTEQVIAEIDESIDRSKDGRPSVPMIAFTGSNNRFDFSQVIVEIDTAIYPKMPDGYLRCMLISGNRNKIHGLTIRNVGADRGSNGNLFSTLGDGNVIEEITLHVFGSQPHGYGDLLGKGGPNLVSPLLKQSGFMTGGRGNTLRRCRVFSRAFGHCFYLQNATDTRIEDCRAEGEMRPTSDMLRDVSGLAFDLGFKSVYPNRDGRYAITPGYMKSLSEDGFRTYAGVSRTKIINCVAVNTRAGFEIGGCDADTDKTVVENCVATGCERGYLLGSNVLVRRSRGDISFGPLLYLRGGRNSDVELELTGKPSDFTVHALATIAGTGHRVRLSAQSQEDGTHSFPILLGFGMPEHAEIASPILPADAVNITLSNELSDNPIISSKQAKRCTVKARGSRVSDASAH
ncbi:MAG: hypothetical protein V4640_15260 [Verrucomicrobiota bacterium]